MKRSVVGWMELVPYMFNCSSYKLGVLVQRFWDNLAQLRTNLFAFAFAFAFAFCLGNWKWKGNGLENRGGVTNARK